MSSFCPCPLQSVPRAADRMKSQKSKDLTLWLRASEVCVSYLEPSSRSCCHSQGLARRGPCFLSKPIFQPCFPPDFPAPLAAPQIGPTCCHLRPLECFFLCFSGTITINLYSNASLHETSLYTSEMCEKDSQTGISSRPLSRSPLLNQLVLFTPAGSYVPCTCRVLGTKHPVGRESYPVTTLNCLRVFPECCMTYSFISTDCSADPFIKSFL